MPIIMSAVLRPAFFLVLLGLSGLVMAKDYQRINWVDLLPEKDLKALENPPDYISDIEDGSPEDALSNKMLSALEQSTMPDDAYQRALVSTDVVETFNGKAIRLPGFIVPIEMNDKQEVTEFFLVPYFGACIHLPPPPPNQIVYVTSEQGILVEDIYNAYWLEGTIATSFTENEIAQSAYSMTAETVELYTEE
ncbi:DUF3299 domain-containing protein [Methylophaga sp. OBS1]|uniref:DUF3299 domain-containing protein n=1 Tax=Methylophaga sp. OBS1 TaxID=2991933 RepID=UPI00224EF7A5|nr:DUF3299 domain-containing protein [Methylophaga sp. OBS1]MCX4193180.1 DUF3299 domain-containing protein [Methylophaga sp. OBS1]